MPAEPYPLPPGPLTAPRTAPHTVKEAMGVTGSRRRAGRRR